VNNNVELIIRIAESGSPTTYKSGGGDYKYVNTYYSVGYSGTDAGNDSEIDLDRGCENHAHSHSSAALYIDRQKDAENGVFSMYGTVMTAFRSANQIRNRQISAYYGGNGSNVASLRVQFGSGNIDNGRVFLYGLVK